MALALPVRQPPKYYRYRSKSASKSARYLYQSLPFLRASCGEAAYSNRRISTGNSRAASRAGIIVASTAMLSAAIEIHKPSQKLG